VAGETLRTLSAADVTLLQGVLDRMRRLPPGGGGGGEGGGDDYFTPEVYVGRAPALGVPARLGVVPGAAECDVYRIVEAAGAASLEQVPTLTLPVHNLGVESLAPDSFFVAARDKYGNWLAVEPAGSAGSGNAGAPPGTADINYFRHAPCPYQPGWQSRWYTADTGRCPAIVALAVGAGLPALAALPFISPKGGRVGRIAVYLEVAGGSGDTCRVGIYRAPSASDLTPGVLLFGSVPLDASQAGRVESACDLTLEAGVLYYLAASFSGAGRFRCLDAGDLFPVWGLGDDFGAGSFAAAVGLWAFAAAADPLPATFPADALPFSPGDRVPLVAVGYACEPVGSGSGSGGGTGTVPCSPVPVPQTVYLSVFNYTGPAPDPYTGTYVLTLNDVAHAWNSGATGWTLQCDLQSPDSLELRQGGAFMGSGGGTFSPFSFSGHHSGAGTPYGDFDWVVTE
jgi:hypothetical protein